MLYKAKISGERLEDHWSSGNWTLFIFAGNERMHKSLDEFEIRPDATTGFHGNRESYNVKNGVITFARTFLAHLSRRLIGEFLGYSWSGDHPSTVFRLSVVNNVQTSSSLNRLPDESQILCGASFGTGNEILFMHMGHMTKIATTPLYGKNPSKTFFSGTGGPISTNLICSIGDS